MIAVGDLPAAKGIDVDEKTVKEIELIVTDYMSRVLTGARPDQAVPACARDIADLVDRTSKPAARKRTSA